MLRRGCGFALAHGRHDTRAIQEWLEHRNIQHTTRYTELTTHRDALASQPGIAKRSWIRSTTTF